MKHHPHSNENPYEVFDVIWSVAKLVVSVVWLASMLLTIALAVMWIEIFMRTP